MRRRFSASGEETAIRAAVLVAAGPFGVSEEEQVYLLAAARNADILIGVDGGALHLLACGLVPHVVTGDFDSLSENARVSLSGDGVQIVPTPDQDYTDLDKALRYAITVCAAEEITVFGALGRRLDHTYAALSALVKHGRQAQIRLVDSIGETCLVNETLTLTREQALSGLPLPGRVLSLISLGRVEGIWTSGVRWPLSGETLAPAFATARRT